MNIIDEYQLSPVAVDRIIEMAWEDRTPFEAILFQFGVPEAGVIKLMQQEMTPKNWRRWRERVQGRKTKHQQLSKIKKGRFKSKLQRQISLNKISKKRY